MDNNIIGLLLDIFEDRTKKGSKEERIVAQYSLDILYAQYSKLNFKLTDYHFIKMNWKSWFTSIVSEEELYRRYYKIGTENIDFDSFQADILRKSWISIEVEAFLNGNRNYNKADYIKVDDVDGRKYEDLCVSYFMDLGFYNIEHIGKSGDQGIDIIAYKNGDKYGIQCKYYTKPVTNKAIQEAYSGAAYYGCDKAIVITNNIFTQSAQELAIKNSVILISGMTLNNIISKKKESNEVIDENYYKMFSIEQYDVYFERAIQLIMLFGKGASELLEKGLCISKSRSELIISQLLNMGLLYKSEFDVFYNLSIKNANFVDGIMYVYRFENELYNEIDDSVCEMYGITAYEYLSVIQKPFDTRLYTKMIEGIDDIVCICADYLIVYQNYVFINQDKRNSLRLVRIPLIGITGIEYRNDVMIIIYDKDKWRNISTIQDYIIQDFDNNAIKIRIKQSQKSNFITLGKIIAARIGMKKVNR